MLRVCNIYFRIRQCRLERRSILCALVIIVFFYATYKIYGYSEAECRSRIANIDTLQRHSAESLNNHYLRSYTSWSKYLNISFKTAPHELTQLTRSTDRDYLTRKNFTSDEFKKLTEQNLNSNEIGYPHRICKCGRQPYSLTNLSSSQSPYSSSKSTFKSKPTSTCSHEATEYGIGQRVRSYSLFIHADEDIPLFLLPLEANMEDHMTLFPGWITRIYSNISVTNPHVCALICKYETLFWCDIRNIPEMGDLSGMYGRTWRFLVMGDPTVDIFLSRDMDSNVFTRERAAVAEWEISTVPFHSMRDNPGQSNEMLAGMWGAKNFLLGPVFSKSLQSVFIQAATKENPPLNWDEQILLEYLYTPYSSCLFLVHDSYYCWTTREFKTLPFPMQRYEDQTIGQPYVKNVTKFIYEVPPCPYGCRPSYGKDWVFC